MTLLTASGEGLLARLDDAEFKREALRLPQTGGKSIAQVAREVGISDTSIHQWRKELAEHVPEAFPVRGHQTAHEKEVCLLKRELEVVKQERDILKDTIPYCGSSALSVLCLQPAFVEDNEEKCFLAPTNHL